MQDEKRFSQKKQLNARNKLRVRPLYVPSCGDVAIQLNKDGRIARTKSADRLRTLTDTSDIFVIIVAIVQTLATVLTKQISFF